MLLLSGPYAIDRTCSLQIEIEPFHKFQQVFSAVSPCELQYSPYRLFQRYLARFYHIVQNAAQFRVHALS